MWHPCSIHGWISRGLQGYSWNWTSTLSSAVGRDYSMACWSTCLPFWIWTQTHCFLTGACVPPFTLRMEQLCSQTPGLILTWVLFISLSIHGSQQRYREHPLTTSVMDDFKVCWSILLNQGLEGGILFHPNISSLLLALSSHMRTVWQIFDVCSNEIVKSSLVVNKHKFKFLESPRKGPQPRDKKPQTRQTGLLVWRYLA